MEAGGGTTLDPRPCTLSPRALLTILPMKSTRFSTTPPSGSSADCGMTSLRVWVSPHTVLPANGESPGMYVSGCIVAFVPGGGEDEQGGGQGASAEMTDGARSRARGGVAAGACSARAAGWVGDEEI